jgi:hypothetical protein
MKDEMSQKKTGCMHKRDRKQGKKRRIRPTHCKKRMRIGIGDRYKKGSIATNSTKAKMHLLFLSQFDQGVENLLNQRASPRSNPTFLVNARNE